MSKFKLEAYDYSFLLPKATFASISSDDILEKITDISKFISKQMSRGKATYYIVKHLDCSQRRHRIIRNYNFVRK